MQVITCMHPDSDVLASSGPRSLGALETRRRILEAAGRVFARDGFRGATTREIAREAQVNEVTLFRHFRSRNDLLRAVLCRPLEKVLVDPADERLWVNDLRAAVRKFVESYYAMLVDKEALVRAYHAESKTISLEIREIIAERAAPVRNKLIERLERAQKAGLVRSNINLVSAADLLRDALHAAMLRFTGCVAFPGSDLPTHLEAVIDVYVTGIEKRS
jgi:AcrR family transcriptional regulator